MRSGFLARHSVLLGWVGFGVGLIGLGLTVQEPKALAPILLWLGWAFVLISPIVAYLEGQRLPPLNEMSADQLREHTFAFAARLRDYEANAQAAQDASSRRHRPYPATEEARRQRWYDDLRANDARRAAMVREYRTSMHGDAVALRDELHFRLRLLGNVDDRPVIALDQGALIGPTPLQEAADYLELLARRLL